MSCPPSNFSWVSESVAGFAFPSSKENLNFLVNNAHITRLITLNDEKPKGLDYFPSNFHVPFNILIIVTIVSISFYVNSYDNELVYLS